MTADIESADLRGRFLDGMSQAACTVSVVTTDGPAGRAGVTVSAMASVSADTPSPSLLVCVHHKSPAAQAILDNGVFCVNVLADSQIAISDTFAGRLKPPGGDKFSCAEWTTQKTGAPRVVDPLVAFDCKLVSGELVGTHHVFMGAVEDIFVGRRGSPLIYASRAYGTATPLAVREDAQAGPGEVLRLGCFHTFGPYVVPEIVERMTRESGTVSLMLDDGDQRHVVEGLRSGASEIALIYDLGLDHDEIEVDHLTTLKPYVLLGAGHPLAERGSLSLANLAPEPMVLLNAPPSGDYFLSLFAAAGLEPHVAHRAGSFEMVRGLVGHGLGYTLLATKPASAMTYDGRALVARPLEGEVSGSALVLARRRGSEVSAIAETFTAHCREFFASGS